MGHDCVTPALAAVARLKSERREHPIVPGLHLVPLRADVGVLRLESATAD